MLKHRRAEENPPFKRVFMRAIHIIKLGILLAHSRSIPDVCVGVTKGIKLLAPY